MQITEKLLWQLAKLAGVTWQSIPIIFDGKQQYIIATDKHVAVYIKAKMPFRSVKILDTNKIKNRKKTELTIGKDGIYSADGVKQQEWIEFRGAPHTESRVKQCSAFVNSIKDYKIVDIPNDWDKVTGATSKWKQMSDRDLSCNGLNVSKVFNVQQSQHHVSVSDYNNILKIFKPVRFGYDVSKDAEGKPFAFYGEDGIFAITVARD